jgi:hypothetical protein
MENHRSDGENWMMQFSDEERQALLLLKGVGATVIKRLEQIGLGSLTLLRDQAADDVTLQISQLMGSTCWHNSPQARASIQAVIDLAQHLAQPGGVP